MVIKKFLVNQVINLNYFLRYVFLKRKKFNILSFDETINKIIKEKKSIARFGDGEIKWMFGIKNGGFQENDKKMQMELLEIFNNKNNDRCLICIYDALSNLHSFSRGSAIYWMKFIVDYYPDYISKMPNNYTYGQANMTRPYMDYRNKSPKIIKSKFDSLKKIWDSKKIVIVEGEYTKLGVGNDLFNNAKSVERIICPAVNAYSKIKLIMDEIKKNSTNKLYLIALGPTATILAYRLSEFGYQCIDIGHIDIEYEWFLRGAKEKIEIKGKYINELNNNFPTNIDYCKEYTSQIISRIRSD